MFSKEGFVGLRCNVCAVSGQRRWTKALRGSASHAVLALAAVAALNTPALADINAGETVKISATSGDTTLNGGTIQIDAAKEYSRQFTFKDVSGNTIDIYGTASELSGKLTGDGGVTFTDSIGGGVLSISGENNNFTGSVTIDSGATVAIIDEGVLYNSDALDDAADAGSIVTINGTLDISESDYGASVVSLSGSGNIILGSLSFRLTEGQGDTFSGVISGTGSLVLSSGAETLTGINTYTGYTSITSGTLYITGAGSIASSSSVVVYGTLDMSGANAAELKSLSGSGSVVLGANDLVLTNASGSFSGVISGTGGVILKSGTQWLGGDDTFTGGVTIEGGTLQVGSSEITYDVANSGTFSFYSSYAIDMSGVISGTGSVTKLGAGIATISTVQTYTGSTTVTYGTLKLTGAGSIASSSGVQVDGVLDLTESNSATVAGLTGTGTVRLGEESLVITNGSGDFSGTMTGTGTLTINGGTQSFSGTNTYTGITTVNSGGTLALVMGGSLKSTVNLVDGAMQINNSLTASGNATIASLTGTGTVALGANTLVLSNAAGTFDGSISGTGGFTVSGGSETLTGISTYTGTTTVASGATLVLTGSLATASTLKIDGTFNATGAAGGALTFASLSGSGSVNLGAHQLVLANASGSFSGVISGTVGLAVTGGTQVLSGTNTYTGGSTIASGAMLQIGNGAASGSILGDVANEGTLRFYRMDTSTFSGVISGSGVLAQGGVGTTILTGDNTYTGETIITSGTLQVGDGGTTGSLGNTSAITVEDGTLAFARTNAVTLDAAISGTGKLIVKSGSLELTGVNTYEGTTTVNSGATLILSGSGSVADSRGVTLNGTLDISGTAAGATVASLSGTSTASMVLLGTQYLTIATGAGTYAGVISGTGGLVLTGGSQVLSGINTYSGATTVSGGTLSVTGSITNSDVTVQSGGTFSGSGTIANLTVESGGTIKAGVNGAGTLTVNGDVVLEAGSSYAVDVTSDGAASIAATGSASVNGALSITSSDGTYYLGEKVAVLTADGGITYGTSFSATNSFTGDNGAVFKTTIDRTSDADTLYLTINLDQLTPALSADANINQTSVVGGIDAAIAAGETLPLSFEQLGNDTAGQLTTDSNQLTGEIGADMPLVSRAMFNPFMDVMSMRTAMLRPLPRGSAYPMETWIYGFTGTDIVKGDETGDGSHKFHANVMGVAGGAQWQPWSNILIGGALAVGKSDFRIGGDLGKGDATSIQAGVYGQIRMSRHFYNAFSAGLGLTQIKTTRVLDVSGTDTLTGKVTSVSLGGRYEAGIWLPWFTPYFAAQDQISQIPGYTEKASSGNTTFALHYASRTSNAGRLEAGVRYNYDLEVTPRWILTPDFTIHLTNRFAYAYDISDGSGADAVFNELPSSDFVVRGAKTARHSALVTVGGDILFEGGFRATVHLDSAFTERSQSFTGFVGFGYNW